MSNKIYNVLKWLALIALPALSTLVFALSNIWQGTFQYCRQLNSLTIKATVPPVLGGYAFTASPAIIYVPAARVNAYKTATNWSAIASRIQAIPE